ncbi:PKD domain-containing protein [Sphingobium sufflavum]|uniref:PKD domain-containing protein n=1 Tax=Sphingobium sufflavum TaxID=1129547 RepID=UPI001F43269C|nr:PKD domain-containing protein [Sphingobium sufflavum]MCE7798852.1 PKD domain-containing protein [Sphingobium sufflavum]
MMMPISGKGCRIAIAGCALSVLGGASLHTAAVADAPAAAVPRLYTPDTDPLFSQPYIDIDEWRGTPVRHRYVHGGFKGTDTRFSFYFPAKAQYQGRFFQHITPIPDNENFAPKMPVGEYNKIGFSIDSGAYFVETNGGGHLDLGKSGAPGGDSSITAYKANAAVAAYSRIVALKIYGGKRPYGYAYGGSGGGYRTIGSIENTHGVWDGVVPYVIGSTMAIPNMFTVRMQAMRILKDKFPQIIDAVEPGGSGNPYAGLTREESDALREVTRMGFPPQSWFGYKSMGVHGFAALYGGVLMADPGYFKDFWIKPGYLGHDHPVRFEKARMQFETGVASPITGLEAAKLGLNTDASTEVNRGGVDNAFKAPQGAAATRIVAVRLTGSPPKVDFVGGDLFIHSGKLAGQRLTLARIVGDIAVFGVVDDSLVAQLAAGDKVSVDNSNFLAMESYHRHQVPSADFKVWDQFRTADGKPVYPQRPMLLGPLFVRATAGSLQTGKFEGKMIVVASLWDREAMPWQADWYRRRVEANLGTQADQHFRLYYTDHALHGDEMEQEKESPNRIVTYQGMLQQALRDLSAWVEKGIVPPASTQYRTDDGQLVVPPTATKRLGIQPVVTLAVDGARRADILSGQAVTFTAKIESPPGSGFVVGASWDFDGNGQFKVGPPVAKGVRSLSLKVTHLFTKSGTYFVALKGVSQRQGNATTPYARLYNLDRVRVVVK